MTRLNWDDTKEPTTLNDLFDTVLVMMMMMMKCDIRQMKLLWLLQSRKKLGRVGVNTGWILTYSPTTQDTTLEKNDTQGAYADALIDTKIYIKFRDFRAALWRLSLGRNSL
jgi:hypothetical protein